MASSDHSIKSTQQSIETSRARIAQRLQAYRDIHPDPATPLLVTPGEAVATHAADIPEVAASELTAEVLRNAMRDSGCLLVRGLLKRDETDELRHAIDRVLEYCEANAAGARPEANPFFAPPETLASIMPRKERELGNTRSFHRESGSAMCVEAPVIAETLLRRYTELGLKELLTSYLGERPCLSAKKWVLRRSKLPVSEAGWHQDGAFMGTQINSLNLWLPLSNCGGDSGAPGLDVIPQRLSEIASAEGAQFDWSVSASQASKAAGHGQVTSPTFSAGDALFFDHFFLHRTQYGKEFGRVRYAIETWFFGASSFPKNQIPLEW